MKVSKLIDHLKELDQEAEIYYDNAHDEYGLGGVGIITFSYSDLENSPKGEYILRPWISESESLYLRTEYDPEYRHINEIIIKRIKD